MYVYIVKLFIYDTFSHVRYTLSKRPHEKKRPFD